MISRDIIYGVLLVGGIAFFAIITNGVDDRARKRYEFNRTECEGRNGTYLRSDDVCLDIKSIRLKGDSE